MTRRTLADETQNAEAVRMTTTEATTRHTENTPAARSVGLRTTLALITFASVFGLGKAIFEREVLFASFPKLTPMLLNTMIAIAVVGFACVVGVWVGRRVGVWIGPALIMCEFAIELYVGIPWIHLFRLPATLVLVAVFVRPQWSAYK